jgi:HNH endonuclease
MAPLGCFSMPTRVRIVGRTSSITNSFVNSIIPVVFPTEDEVCEALAILELNPGDLRCTYCGDLSTEWDHLRPLVSKKQPTGYISEMANLVPACGKCNQSKGSAHWEAWMRGPALLSPATRKIADLEQRVERLRRFETWRMPKRVDFAEVVGVELWARHWKNNERLHALMYECQKTADEVYKRVLERAEA